MISADEEELHRLSDMLAAIEGMLPGGSPLREGLAKAGLALIHTFMLGSRVDIEKQFGSLDAPLCDEQRAHLVRLGSKPEA